MSDPIPALARIVHFACVATDGEYALRHKPADHERTLRVAWSYADPADIAALASPAVSECEHRRATPCQDRNGSCGTHLSPWAARLASEPTQPTGAEAFDAAVQRAFEGSSVTVQTSFTPSQPEERAWTSDDWEAFLRTIWRAMSLRDRALVVFVLAVIWGCLVWTLVR